MVRQAHQQSGKATPSLPGEDGSDDERTALEEKHTGKLYAAFRAILKRVVPPGTTVDNISPDIAIRRYREASPLLRDALVAMLSDGVLLGAQVGGYQVEFLLGVRKDATILGVDWDLINQDALAWVLSNPSQLGQGFGDGYASAVAAAMNTTSENQLNTLVGEWIRNGLTYNSLIDQLTATTFSRQRSEMVAVTEITRSFYQGNVAAWRRSGVITRHRFRTANDERVCSQCGPLNGQVVELGGAFTHPDSGAQYFGIPLHPRCRCFASPVVNVPDEREILQQDMTPLQTQNLQPIGTPVSAALQLPTRGKLAQPISDTVASIDKVHGDGALPELPVLTGSMKDKGGYYKHESASGKPIEIKLSTQYETPRTAMAHETGHFLEAQGMIPAVNAKPESMAQVKKLNSAFLESAAVKRLGALVTGKETIKIDNGSGKIIEYPADWKYVLYLKDSKEVWARAYSQYITIRSGDSAMLEELRKEQAYYYPTAWADDDFEPIANAIDDLFKALGWVK